MDARSAAHALSQVAMLLELHGEDRNAVQNFQAASRIVAGLTDTALDSALRDNTLLLAADALSVVQELVATNGSVLLESLQEQTPEGLLEMLLVPGLGPTKIRLIHDGLHVETLQELERAARDGRLAALPRFGDKTAEKIRRGIADLRASGAPVLWAHANSEAERLRQLVAAHPDVLQVAVAGSIRRRCELVRDIDLVAAVRGSRSVVAASLAHDLPGIHDVLGGGSRTLTVRFTDGVRLDLACVRPEQFALALWRATGSAQHVRAVAEHAARIGFTLAGDLLLDANARVVDVENEQRLYAILGLDFIEPELREADGEVEAAAEHRLPQLVSNADIIGAVHCHSQYSDGGATIAEMANAAIALGWKYLGISDHSQSNTYAGGLAREAILRQHEEVAAINAAFARDGLDFRILQGIEADILPCGRVDYDAQFLDRFDFVIASIHSRYGMDKRQMTERVLKALDDPHITILGHPTGRLLLTREPYAIDMDAVIEKAGAVGVAVELNADPHRVDIDWRLCRIARQHGTMVSIGPDAHSPLGLENAALGIATARKGWLEAADILNSRTAGEVLEFARARRVAALL
jgi:DNA polymerase (family 10)